MKPAQKKVGLTRERNKEGKPGILKSVSADLGAVPGGVLNAMTTRGCACQQGGISG